MDFKAFFIPPQRDLIKTLRIMKLTTLLVCAAFVQASASGYSQNVTLTARRAPLETVFSSIEKQTGYTFYYKTELFEQAKKVNIAVKNERLPKVLAICFAEQPFTYEIIGKTIVVKPVPPATELKEETIPDNLAEISGKITGVEGAPLSGASVAIKGTKTGTSTDAEGRFTISAQKGQVLVISFIGYESREVPVNGGTPINIQLVASAELQGDVVVVGYGVQKKTDLTGSLASVSVKDFKDQPVLDVTSALQGRAAGVDVTNVSGAPGGYTKIRIRGANSIGGGNDPLLVIDGLQLGTLNINDINPDDIENVEILKDASATAIYGSRGANGVILITTKQGKTEKPRINLTSNTGISNRAYKYDLLSPIAYAELTNQATPGTYSEDDLAKLRQGGGTDWQDEIFRSGLNQDYQANVGGRSARSSYFFSGRYINQTGILKNSEFRKFAVRMNVETKLTNRINLGVSAFVARGKGFNNQDQGNLSNAVQQSVIWGPAESIFNPDGSYQLFDPHGAIGKNPVAQILNNYQNNIQNSGIITGKLNYRIFDFLTLDVIGGIDAGLQETDQVTSKYSAFGTPGSAFRNYGNALNMQWSNILTFHKVFNTIHDLTVTGVYEQQKNNYDGTSANGAGGSAFPALLYYSLQSTNGQQISSYYGMSNLRSYVGRINYALMNKYLLTATYRADGSSKFPNNHWGYFPSVAAGWKLSEEEFIRDLNVFSNFKVRGSWGVTGNQGVTPFVTIPGILIGQTTQGGSAPINYAYINNGYGDQNLKWEQTTTTDVGVDLGFFQNRLNLSADYFVKKTKDLLLQVAIPAYEGGGTKLTNVGQVQNKGLDLQISGVPVNTKNVTWNVALNFTSYRNKVLSLGGPEFIEGTTNAIGNGIIPSPPTRVIVGQPIGTYFGYNFLGIYQESEADEAARYGLSPGDSKYQDVTNGKDASGNELPAIDGSDRVVIGNALPDYTWGLNNSIRFKDLEINLFIMASQGNDILNIDYAAAATRIGDSRTITAADVVPWTPENKSNIWPSLTSSSNQERIASSKWLQDASFVRLKNLSVGYRIPSSIIRGAPIKISVSGQNLITLTSFKGFDPEISSRGNSDVDNGIALGAYPSARTITFSLNVNF